MNKKFLLVLFLLIIACTTTNIDNNRGVIITPEKEIEKPCITNMIISNQYFKEKFSIDEGQVTTLYLYLTSEWLKLNSDEQDNVLAIIGYAWFDCSESSGPLTILVYDKNDIPVHAAMLSPNER